MVSLKLHLKVRNDNIFILFCSPLDKKTHTTQLLASSWPMDPHYPLPGNIGIDYQQFAEDAKETLEARKTLANAFLDTEPEEFRKQLLLSQFLDEKWKEDLQEASKVASQLS